MTVRAHLLIAERYERVDERSPERFQDQQVESAGRDFIAARIGAGFAADQGAHGASLATGIVYLCQTGGDLPDCQM